MSALLGLVGLTISGTNLVMESSEVTSLGSGLLGAGNSLFGIFINLAPYLVAFAMIFLAISMISKWIKIKGARGGKRR